MRPEDEELWNQLVAPWKASRPPQLHHPVGCLDCRMTGYAGRVGIYEIMLMSPELKKLIRPDAEMARLREQAYREGMKALRISGATKAAQGLTTLEEVLKVAPPGDQ
jgi:general secretion pathway protein E